MKSAKRRLASWVLWREEHWLPVPSGLVRWAFDVIFEGAEPTVGPSRFIVQYCHPLMQINPQPRTWASGVTRIVWGRP